MENKPEPSLEDLLEQINETLQVLQNHKGPIKMTPDLVADIEKLETAVTNFKEDSQELFEIFDIDIKELQQEILESDSVRSSDKQLIKRAKDIETEARVMKLALAKGIENRRKSPKDKQMGDKRQMKERRKLFKTIGGDQKWIPL
jgi:signal transduction protein with GAF and PtsI domain